MADPQLVQYINAQLQAGYGKEQVRQALAAGGYPPLAIEEAFRDLKGPVSNPQILNFAQQLLQQGYLPIQATAALVQQGFSQHDARAAVKQVYGVNPPGGSRHVALVAFVLITIVVLGLGTYLLIDDGEEGTTPDDDTPVITPQSDQEITAMIIKVADANGKDTAVRQCFSKLKGEARDNCILDIAVLESVRDDTLCDQIQNPTSHDACLMNFLNTDRFESVCSRAKLVASIQTCENIKLLRDSA
ncbi:TPA: hypothetical protein HA251_04925 [Candidatus Woesearchaeota archaeon]|nr:hypothetical protein [Candidatus Woesearchaeota archaeon]